ncbi:xanthine dehydrogenase family protein molybdopterin-binding subunit [Ahrensia sp. R2A130]|uniref:xanthine dehydrogenase family protein molybdopterin-binding subunit n=1 Tax=Ahrensia sp. R2A130 TaxID=744979 RepID=UPI0001E0F0D1|nr:xanthine dehydrogenase family protein molybdopterin-binding subunit [Ahrensia sp. R2A130]EFL88987.1 carbon-monoxide dehydrogenase [Ahrensia sp. R2A130]
MNAMTPPKFGQKVGMGQSVLRKEDAAFITGEGNYTDDVKRDGALHAYVLRSPTAHATFTIEDRDTAASMDGVKLVLTAADIEGHGGLKCQTVLKQVDGTMHDTKDIPLLCDGVVRHVGDAIAFVVAETEAQAREAGEAIEVDFDMLPTVVDTESALSDDAVLVYDDTPNNLAFEVEMGNADRSREIFKSAARVSELKLINNRLICNYMETRGCVAEWSDEEDRYTLTVGSQGVHSMRDALAGQCLNVSPDKLRVVTPDVGGGFGTKVFPYREYPLALIAAKRLGHPVKWRCDRSEHFVADAHGRDNVVTMKMAMDEDGRFLALDVDLIAAMGAYLHTYGPYIPTLGTTIGTGIYDIEACAFHIRGVYTHTTPTDAYRGAGRPEAIYALERLVDQCARDMGVGPDEIRRRNAIPSDMLPYKTPFGRTYDTGEFTAHMDKCMEIAGWGDFDSRANAAKTEGKLRGIGMSTYIEACAFAGSEPAKLELQTDGTVRLLIGTQSNGQGHQTAYAQFAAEVLNLDIDSIDVRQGDTDELATGGGTGGSRSIPLGGVSVKRGSEALAEKIKEIAADKLEAAASDLELMEGEVCIVGTDRSMTLAEVAASTDTPVEATGEFVQDEATFPNGTHVCEVEIDPTTGETEVVAYTIVDDFGTTVNPIMLAGQVHGGVVQAIGQCIMEQTVYDDDGQLVTASFMDYRMPRAQDIPNFHFETRNVPSTTNALGIKGAGEAGTIGGCPAVMNAVVDALHRAYGVEHIDMPVTPLIMWNAIRAAEKQRAA